MKIRKTQTNIKRMQRLKKTIIFILIQIVAIFLFCNFGIAGTTCATKDNTATVTAIVQDYNHYELRRDFRYRIYVDGEMYRTTSNFVTVDHEQFIGFLSESPTVSIRYDQRGRIVQMYSNEIEYVSLDKYNSEQRISRTISIVVFSLVELFVCIDYALYIAYNRTSKDKKWI